VALEQGAAGDVERDTGRAPGLGPLAAREVGLRAVQGLEGCLDVDEGVGREYELDLRSAVK
jgi:hypothetical protein